MVNLEIYTSRTKHTSSLGASVRIDSVRCEYVEWLWNAYELLNLDIGRCVSSSEDSLVRYIIMGRELREARSVRTILNLKRELARIRGELRSRCDDELVCLANRLYEYYKAINMLYRHYLRMNELGGEDLSKLAVALARYNMPLLSLEVYDELLSRPVNDDLKHLTFLSLLNPLRWPTHITMGIEVMPYLNWVLVHMDNHYIILIISLGRAYAISDLDVNINGGRVTLVYDWEFKDVLEDHVIVRVESKNGHGLFFVGNWSDHAVNVALDFRFREGSVKGLFLDANVSQLIPTVVPPHDYLSLKYSV